MGTTADKLAHAKAVKANLKAALTEKGQAPGDVFDTYPDLVRAIETGVQLPELTSPGSAADLRQGKQLIDQEGKVVDGTLVEVEQTTPGFHTVNLTNSNLVTIDTAGNLVIQPPTDIGIDTISGVENFGVRLYRSDTSTKEYREMLIIKFSTEFYDARFLHTFWSGAVSPQYASATLEEIVNSFCYVDFNETTKVLTLTPNDEISLLDYGDPNIYARVTYALK